MSEIMTQSPAGAYCTMKKGGNISRSDKLTTVTFNEIREEFNGNPCPYDHIAQAAEYKNYKLTNLYVFYFVRSDTRPSKNNPKVYTTASNWFVIDVDKFSDELPKEEAYNSIKENCPPFVRFVQMTGKGLHLWCRCSNKMTTETEWKTTYDLAATEVWNRWSGKLKFDGHCRNILQGSYLWKQKQSANWDNPRFDVNYYVDGVTPQPMEVLYENNIGRSHSDMNITTTTATKAVPKDYYTNKQFMEDYNTMRLMTFYERYSCEYEVIKDSGTDFTEYVTYKGDVVCAYKTEGKYYTVWVPRKYSEELHRPVVVKKRDGEGRRKYLFRVATTIMNIMPETTIEQLHFNVLHYFLNYVDNTDKQITKVTLLDLTLRAYLLYEQYHYVKADKRKWIIGDNYTITDEGGQRPITKNEKIALAQALRKTDTMNKVLSVYDTSLSVKENLKLLTQEYEINISQGYLYTLLRENGLATRKPKGKRVSAYRVSDGARLTVREEMIDGVNYVRSKKDLPRR